MIESRRSFPADTADGTAGPVGRGCLAESKSQGFGHEPHVGVLSPQIDDQTARSVADEVAAIAAVRPAVVGWLLRRAGHVPTHQRHTESDLPILAVRGRETRCSQACGHSLPRDHMCRVASDFWGRRRSRCTWHSINGGKRRNETNVTQERVHCWNGCRCRSLSGSIRSGCAGRRRNRCSIRSQDCRR